jgi:histidine triad (HIT) family protein
MRGVLVSEVEHAVADCLFCKIVAGDVPATLVAETDRVLAFRDIAPQAPVHVLVATKEHYPDMAALATERPSLAGELLAVATEVARDEGVTETGYRLVVNTGTGAGQTVFHVHVHVLGGRSMDALG